MIIHLTSVIGNGRHQGRSIRDVMDSDPAFIAMWIRMAPAMLFDLATIHYWKIASRKFEESGRLQADVFQEAEF